MGTSATGSRYCARCGSRLAGDNTASACGPCQRVARETADRPPSVPPEFWDNDQLRDALVKERHIGHVVQRYRKHPFHGQTITQETAARWLSVSQTQLSRIENGRPLYDLDRLIRWAEVLHIPPELLWFALPDQGEDVNRRQFLIAGGAASAAGIVPAVTSSQTGFSETLNAEVCAQWLAWELWSRQASCLNADEIPPQILSLLENLPSAGGLILRDTSDNYSFAHPSLVDFFVAQRVFADLANGKTELLATTQTSHDTDQIIRRFVQHEESCVPVLTRWMRDGATPVLRVNSAGILAKLGAAGIADDVITVLKQDVDTRHLYLTAVASRVLSMPWNEAGKLAGSTCNMSENNGISADRASEIALRLAQEIQDSQDGAARWCSLVLLSRVSRQVPDMATGTLQRALRIEPCRENLRAIACTLANDDPVAT